MSTKRKARFEDIYAKPPPPDPVMSTAEINRAGDAFKQRRALNEFYPREGWNEDELRTLHRVEGHMRAIGRLNEWNSEIKPEVEALGGPWPQSR